MGTLHCALENGADLYVNECQNIYDTIALGLLKKEELEEKKKEEKCQIAIFLLREVRT